jgi:voltage-gated potassium channel
MPVSRKTKVYFIEPTTRGIPFQNRARRLCTPKGENVMFFLVLLKRWRYALEAHPPLAALAKIILTLFLTFFAFAVAYKLAEEQGWEVAFWMSWETLSTVGYGDFPAKEAAGRILTMIAGTLGIVIMTAAIGSAVVVFQYRGYQMRTGKMKNPHKNGYVIFNFPGAQHILSFIQEIRTVEESVGICIVDSALEELPPALIHLPKVHFVSGSTLDRDTYERAGLLQNKAAIVFPVNPGKVESDGSTRMVVDLIAQFSEAKVRIMHVLVDNKNGWMFQNLPSTPISEGLEVLALVQECQDPYSAAIFEHLLTNSEGPDPRTVTPKRVFGMTWNELHVRMLEVGRQTGERVNLLALIRQGRVQLCPNPEEVLKEGDLLSVVCEKGFKWPAFERNIR